MERFAPHSHYHTILFTTPFPLSHHFLHHTIPRSPIINHSPHVPPTRLHFEMVRNVHQKYLRGFSRTPTPSFICIHVRLCALTSQLPYPPHTYQVRLYDVRAPSPQCCVGVFDEHKSWVVKVAVQQGGDNRVLSAEDSGAVKLWDWYPLAHFVGFFFVELFCTPLGSSVYKTSHIRQIQQIHFLFCLATSPHIIS